MHADQELELHHLEQAAEWCTSILSSIPADAWHHRGGGSCSWTVRDTADHIVDALMFYAAHVGARAQSRIHPIRSGDPEAMPEQLIDGIGVVSGLLGRVLQDMERGDRVYHPSGMADRSGIVGMACTELLAHTYDAATGAVEYPSPPENLCSAVLDRIFPWAQSGDVRSAQGSWRVFLSVTGRAGLAGEPPADADWWYQSAPLREWDGIPRRRSVPPQWS